MHRFNLLLKILPYIFHILYFNFKYLSFNQAIKLPILLYRPKLKKTKGRIIIKNENIRTGMIRLGFNTVSIYPNSGIIWENHGGDIIFRGSCNIGNASAISIGKSGYVSLGNNFRANAALKLISYYNVEVKEDVTLGWENIVMDTDFHHTKNMSGEKSKAYNKIEIGNNNWFGLKSTILKGSKTPDFTTVVSNSMLNKPYDIPKYSLLAGSPAKLKKTGIYFDINDNSVEYPER